jgi:ElaB/YqjD/DUF883 family membrane-anchored ribosome-binding protein
MDPRNPNPTPGPGGTFAGPHDQPGFDRESWSGNPAFEDRPPRAQHGTPGAPHPREGVERIKGSAAHALAAAADLLRTRAEGASGQFSALTDYGRQASDLLSRSARYIEELDVDRLQERLEDAVRRNPGRSLLVAGAVGFVLGATLRRR